MSEWHTSNRAAIARRLAPLLHLPDGTLHEHDSGLHRIRVIKHGAQVHVYFVESDGQLCGPMSRIDLRAPLDLLATYMRAMLVALVWLPEPRRACLLGFAGGRLSLVLHHCFPALAIDNVELDPAFGPLAEQYFGVVFDERQRLLIGDARAHLEGAAGAGYDLVVMDAFSDGRDNLDRLATVEFYAACRRAMSPEGVLCVNLLRSDPRLPEKLAALRVSFRQVYVAERRRSLVALAHDRQRLAADAMARAAAELDRRLGFGFSLAEQAAGLSQHRDLGGPHAARPLSDRST